MKVVFVNSNNKSRVISEVKDEKEGIRAIMNFLKERNYISYYQRLYEIEYQGEPSICIDVGSYTEFFYIINGTMAGLHS